MILLCEHPVPSGCESAQSISRSSLRRPGAPAGCSRYERLLDTASRCAASSTVVRPTCAPPPPWPPLSASGDSDANTLCGVRDQDALQSAPLPPATFGKQVASYLGLIPREHSSGGRQKLGAI